MAYTLDYTGQEVNERLQLFDLIYPVGSIYMSVNVVSPTTLFGGEWEQIQNTFLLAAGSDYAAGSIGGETTHTLSVNEMPAHTHTFTGTASSHSHTSKIFNINNQSYTMAQSGIRLTSGYEWVDISIASDITTAGSSSGDPCGITSNTSITPKGTNTPIGNSAAHNNMPPYLAVYIWKRIA